MTGHLSPPWPAPLAPAAVRGRVVVPGSKSETNRALLLAALSGGDATVTGAPPTRDTALMLGALAALGVPTGRDGQRITFGAHDGLRGGGTVDCGLAGTVMRFVPPLAATAKGDVTFDGDDAARRRPMGVVLDALRDLGVEVAGDSLPFTLRGTGAVPGGTVDIDASASSQFVSGLLLAAPSFDGPLTVRHVGPPVPSQPHIDMTVAALRHVGVEIDDSEHDVWRVTPGPVATVDGGDRARPVQRHPVPGGGGHHRGPGHCSRLARLDDPGRRRHPGHPRANGSPVALDEAGLTVDRTPGPDGHRHRPARRG